MLALKNRVEQQLEDRSLFGTIKARDNRRCYITVMVLMHVRVQLTPGEPATTYRGSFWKAVERCLRCRLSAFVLAATVLYLRSMNV